MPKKNELLKPGDYAKIKRIKERFSLTNKEIADIIGFSPKNACNICRWLARKHIPLVWQKAFLEKIMTLTEADMPPLVEKRYQARLARNKN